METEFLNLGLDIIGLGVFNYNFRSLTTESPVIKVQGFCTDCIVNAAVSCFVWHQVDDGSLVSACRLACI